MGGSEFRASHATEVCRCGAHAQHKVYRFLFYNPGVPCNLVARELGMSHLAVRLAKSRLARRKDIHLRCPECFKPTLQRWVCTNCGVELDQVPVMPDEVEDSSIVHRIQPFDGLGSLTAYKGGLDAVGNWAPMKMQYGGANIKHKVERPTNRLLENCKSLLWQELKGPMPRDEIVEEANRLIMREVRMFQAQHAPLVRSKKLAEHLVSRVFQVLKLRYPGCFTVSGGAS